MHSIVGQLSHYQRKSYKFYLTNTDLISLSQGFVGASLNLFQQSIQPYNIKQFGEHYMKDPIRMLNLMQDNYSEGFEMDTVRLDFWKGTKRGFYVMCYRSFCRLLVDVKYDVTVEGFIQTKADNFLRFTENLIKKFFNTIKNSTIGDKGIEATELRSLTSSPSIIVQENLSAGWINLARGREKALNSFAIRYFYHFAETSISIMEIFYNKYMGKEEEELPVILQRIATEVACNLSSSIGYMLTSYLIFTFLDKENVPVTFLKIILEHLMSTILVGITRGYMSQLFPRIDR